MSKKALGKGLASLIPVQKTESFKDPDTAVSKAPDSAKDRCLGISLVRLKDIRVNPYQPRKAFSENAIEHLANSIRQNGLLQPLLVRKTKTGYELIAGERRFRASQKVDLKLVPVVIRSSTDRESLQLALIENIQREDLNPVEEAMAYHQLKDLFGLSQEQIATQVGKDRATVANSLRLLKLPSALLESLKKKEIFTGHAKLLLSLESVDAQFKLYRQILDEKLSVRQTEQRIAFLKEKKQKTSFKKKACLNPYLQSVEENLIQLWQTKIKIQGSLEEGKLTFFYQNKEQLDHLLRSLKNHKVESYE